jgi:hypothetical protein
MLFIATGRVSTEGLKAEQAARPVPEGMKRLAEYVVPGSHRFFGIYQAENLTSLSLFLRDRPAFAIDSLQPVLHLENVLLLEESPAAPPAADGDLGF